MVHGYHSRGFASILALLFLAIFASLAIALMSAANGALLKADNQTHVQSALMASESGLAFHSYVLRHVSVPTGVSGQAMMAALSTNLSTQPQIVGNLGASAVSYNGTTGTIGIPSLSLGGQTFDASISLVSSTTVAVKVTGHSGNISRCVTMNAGLTGGGAYCPSTGIVSRGPISLDAGGTGISMIKYSTTTSEGSLYTSTTTNPAITMAGNAVVQGDLYLSNGAGQVSLSGNYSIGGATGSAALNHVHSGVDPIDIPEADSTVYAPYATNIVDASTSTTGIKTFTNIRIKANTNPTFSGIITLKGVVYIEKPNKVTFNNCNLSITGLIVTDPGHDTTNNQINFIGNITTAGVESLPDTGNSSNMGTDFHDLRQLPGAFLLAPGFAVNFSGGNFGTVNGMMAAESFAFTGGNAGGTIKGSIINYGSSTLSLTGNTTFTFNHSTYTGTIPGLGGSPKLVLYPTTYVESPN